MKRGYVKLWRRSKSSSVFAHAGMWKLWCLCLLKANHQETEVMWPGLLKPIKLKPGQFITGRDALHFEYHQGDTKKYRRKAAPSVITLYRWLINLEKMQMLHIKKCNKYSIITITNWSQYQENEQQVNIKGTSNEHKQECIKNEENKYISQVQDIFSYWQQVMGHSRAKSTKGRRTKIMARLEEGYTAEQIKQAIDGCKVSKYHMGQNDDGTVYDDLTLICRSGEKLESFIHKTQRKPKHTFLT